MFRDRTDAGRRLAEVLRTLGYAGADAIVLALPRGGVQVAVEISLLLGTPIDVFMVRKVGAPMQPELALGALAEGGEVYIDGDILNRLGVRREEVDTIVDREAAELRRRVEKYRGGRPLPPLDERTVILVDDGIATGATVRAAVRSLRTRRPARLALAVPVAAPEAVAALQTEVDDLVCLEVPLLLWSIGEWYEDFPQLSDNDVIEALERARRRTPAATVPTPGP